MDVGIPWAFALDSKYVVEGVNGGAKLWKENDLQSQSGYLVSHADLWIMVLDLLSALGHSVSVLIHILILIWLALTLLLI